MKDLSNENVIHVKKNGVEYLQFKKLLEYSDIITHAYSLGVNKDYRTIGANLKLLPKDVYEDKMKNYKELCNCININFNNLTKPTQNHTDEVMYISKKELENTPDINLKKYDNKDGIITDSSNIALLTTNADCILMLFYDPVKNVIANVHSGWKGTFQKIGQKCAIKMIKEHGCNPKDIICCMTPSIRKCHFEVEKDVADKCLQIFEYTGKIDDIMEQKSETKWNIDTILINRIILEEVGLKEENIIDSGICSVCEQNQIHSFRAEGKGYGLETAIIQIN